MHTTFRTLYSLISQFVYDLGFPALLRLIQASGHINSYEVGQKRASYIQLRAGTLTLAVISGIAALFDA
ncbi:hypothetical protein [Limnospira fusiformis]|uniref:hypothetical protein n=1 Tax=Limnospira fusiformis TaxID=54297 RepID=UPI0034E08072